MLTTLKRRFSDCNAKHYQQYLTYINLLCIERRSSTVRHFRLYIAYLLLVSAKFVLLSVTTTASQQQHSEETFFWRVVLHYDAIFVYFGDHNFNMAAIAGSSGLAYMANKFYSLPNSPNNLLLGAILEEQESRDSKGRPYYDFFLYEKRRTCTKIKRLFSLLYIVRLNMRSVWVLVLPLMHYAMLQYICNHFDLLKTWNTLTIIFTVYAHICSILLIDLYIATYFELLADVFIVGTAQLVIFLTKLQQLHRFTLVIRSSLGFQASVNTFHQHWTSVLAHLAAYNSIYGSAFTAFLLVNCPLSVYLTIRLLQWRRPTSLNTSNTSKGFVAFLVITVYLIFEIVALFFLHYYFALVSKRAHASASRLHSLAAEQCNSRSDRKMKVWYPVKKKACLSFLTRLSGLVCSVNTVNRYSITYGKLGKVTLMAFSNFLALYCKFLMVTYKILNNYS